MIVLVNFFIIFITERMYSNITRRNLSKVIESIDIWNDVFNGISFISVLISGFITGFTAKGLERFVA